MTKYKKGETETSENGEASFEVEKNSAVEDKLENNPETQIKMLITNNKTKEVSNVVVKLYHTNQSIHLQEGKRMGKDTSTSLLADHLEGHWKRNMTDNINAITDANEQLKAMVLKSGMATRARTGSGEPILHCDMCSYSSAVKHRLNMLKISTHSGKIKTIKMSASKRKSWPNKSIEIPKVAPKKLIKDVESVGKVSEPKEIPITTTFPCTKCGFVYNSENDLVCHSELKHSSAIVNKKTVQHVKEAEETKSDATSNTQEQKTKQDSIIITTEIEKKDQQEQDQKVAEEQQKEEFLDREKERLYIEAENWRKTAQYLDLDLKQALKSNEKLVKDKLGMEEDYKKVTSTAGHLQEKVYALEEEVKEMKLKVELDNEEKEKALFANEELQRALDQEGVPKRPLCNCRFPTIDVLGGHMDLQHQDGQLNNVSDNEVMENSDQSGYGNTKDYQLISVKCTKCNETFQNNHLLGIHMKKHKRDEQKVINCNNCEFKTSNENSYMEHIIESHSTIHICQTCNNKFPSKNEMVEHMKREHSSQPSK